MSNQKGKFIVFEGVDGSGTSTQTALLQRYILEKESKCILTFEPSPGPIGNLIREIHTERIFVTEDRQSRERELAYLFAADRHDHLYNDKNGIVRLINDGSHVISSRYYLSSFVYHTFSQADLDFVKYLNKDFPMPDLMVYIDCPVDVSIKRISASRTPDLNEQRENLERVQKNFYLELESYSGRKLILDGTEDPNVVHQKIVSEVDALLG